MIFTDVRLQNFRSYQDSSFELSSGVTIIVGPNAAGKTNLLEAIMVTAIGKSYRASYIDLVKHGNDWARLDVHTTDNSTRTVKIVSEDRKADKTYEIDNKKYKILPLGKKQPIVLFEPNNLMVLQGDPSGRRDYVDNLLEQIIAGFPRLRADYRRALSQRNSLLKADQLDDSIFAWDLRLSELAEKIVRARAEVTNQIDQIFHDIYSKIAGKDHQAKIEYTPLLPIENYASNMLKKLQENISTDKSRGFTGFGPHREDLKISIDGNLAGTTSSRGEIRTLLLALKIIELELLEAARGTQPTLLLDDVFSELDGSRRRALTKYLANYQTIITTTDADIVTKNFSQNCQIIPLG